MDIPDPLAPKDADALWPVGRPKNAARAGLRPPKRMPPIHWSGLPAKNYLKPEAERNFRHEDWIIQPTEVEGRYVFASRATNKAKGALFGPAELKIGELVVEDKAKKGSTTFDVTEVIYAEQNRATFWVHMQPRR